MQARRHYARYHCTYTDEWDSVQEAAGVAVADEENGESITLKIEDEDGRIVWKRTGVAIPTELDRLENLAKGLLPE